MRCGVATGVTAPPPPAARQAIYFNCNRKRQCAGTVALVVYFRRAQYRIVSKKNLFALLLLVSGWISFHNRSFPRPAEKQPVGISRFALQRPRRSNEMTNTDAKLSPREALSNGKKRAGAAFTLTERVGLLAKYRSSREGARLGCTTAGRYPHDGVIQLASPRRAVSLVQALPQEMLEVVLAFLDGQTLVHCSLVCRVMATLSYDCVVWKNICVKNWSTLRTQTLPQLPGAPDYDVSSCCLLRWLTIATYLLKLLPFAADSPLRRKLATLFY